jgi:hypothetical protein
MTQLFTTPILITTFAEDSDDELPKLNTCDQDNEYNCQVRKVDACYSFPSSFPNTTLVKI